MVAPPIPAEIMLRIYFMQQWYGLSAPAMEDSLYDIESMRRFTGVDIEHIPDETTSLNFRHFLERHHLTERLFEITAQYLSGRGLLPSEGTIVDATNINAPSSTKNQDRQRDPEMKQAKTHIGTDTQRRIHSVAVTDVSAHDSKIMEDCLHGEEQTLYGNKAYPNEERKQSAQAQGGMNWRVNRKVRYRGLDKNAAQVFALFALANFYKVRHELLVTTG